MDYEEEIIYELPELPKRKRPLRIRVTKRFAVCFFCVVVFLIFAAILYNWAMHFENTDHQTPKMKLQSSYHQDGFFMVEITNIDHELCFNRAEYYLFHEDGTAVVGEQGAVEDIYCLDMTFYPHNISYVDLDVDDQLSPGDYFILRSSWQGGPAEEGMILKVKFDVTGDTMGAKKLETKIKEPELPLPTTRWGLEMLDEENMTINRELPAMSCFTLHTALPVNFSLSYRYTGDTATNVSFILEQDNSTVQEVMGQVIPDEGDFVTFCLWRIDDYPRSGPDPFILHYKMTVRDWDTNRTLAVTNIYPLCNSYYPSIG